MSSAGPGIDIGRIPGWFRAVRDRLRRPLDGRSTASHGAAVANYYRWQAPIYDLTRWSFLFGRQRMLREAAQRQPQAQRVLEIGCGTGRNLDWLHRRFPQALCTGVDLSPGMLVQARRRLAPAGARVQLVEGAFSRELVGQPQDLIVLSYVLTMAGPARQALLAEAVTALAPGGVLAVVDFDRTSLPAFRRWMQLNHVDLDPQLRPELARLAPSEWTHSGRAYAGLWRWFIHLHRAAA